MIKRKTAKEINILEEAGTILATILHAVGQEVAPGVSTQELEEHAVELLQKNNVESLFQGHQDYPAVSCISLNHEIVHGIPRKKKIIKEGDIVGIDVGLWHKGLCVDGAITVPTGKISEEARKLLDVTKTALQLGIAQAHVGNNIGDIGHAIQTYIEGQGLTVIQGLVGHGVGYALWEEPHVPNHGRPGQGPKIKPGLVIAIEPMVSTGSAAIKTLDDGWTIATTDGSLAAQFEHTIAVTNDGPIILTEYKE